MLETQMGQLEDQKEDWDTREHEDEHFKQQGKMLAEQIHEICEQINTVQKECHDMEVQPLDEDNRDEMNLQNLDCIEVMMELQQLNTESQDAEQYYDDRHTECMESGDDTQAILARSYHMRQTTQTEQDQEEGQEDEQAPVPVEEAPMAAE